MSKPRTAKQNRVRKPARGSSAVRRGAARSPRMYQRVSSLTWRVVVELEVEQVIESRDGRVYRVDKYSERSVAHEAAELSE